MNNIVLSKKQAKAIAREIYGDIDYYCGEHFGRYFVFVVNEYYKFKGQPPLEPEAAEGMRIIMENMKTLIELLCDYVDNNSTDDIS